MLIAVIWPNICSLLLYVRPRQGGQWSEKSRENIQSCPKWNPCTLKEVFK